MRPVVFVSLFIIGCAEVPDAEITAEPMALSSCNAFQPAHCGSCADVFPFEQALPVTVPWCGIGLCQADREPWFCNPIVAGVPFMCHHIGGSMPDHMNVYCCDPVAANQPCASDADCGVPASECYVAKCGKGTCSVVPKPSGTPCSIGTCEAIEPGRPVACAP